MHQSLSLAERSDHSNYSGNFLLISINCKYILNIFHLIFLIAQLLQHNTQMLKGVFKKLDPSVMRPLGDVKGEVQLSFKYDFNNEMLLTKVIKCRDLANKDIRGKMSNFYAKVF